MPTIGRASASSERPIALMKALRRNSENSASPYDVRPFFIPCGLVIGSSYGDECERVAGGLSSLAKQRISRHHRARKVRPGSVLRSDCGGRPCGPTPLRCSVCGRAA